MVVSANTTSKGMDVVEATPVPSPQHQGEKASLLAKTTSTASKRPFSEMTPPNSASLEDAHNKQPPYHNTSNADDETNSSDDEGVGTMLTSNSSPTTLLYNPLSQEDDDDDDDGDNNDTDDEEQEDEHNATTQTATPTSKRQRTEQPMYLNLEEYLPPGSMRKEDSLMRLVGSTNIPTPEKVIAIGALTAHVDVVNGSITSVLWQGVEVLHGIRSCVRDGFHPAQSMHSSEPIIEVNEHEDKFTVRFSVIYQEILEVVTTMECVADDHEAQLTIDVVMRATCECASTRAGLEILHPSVLAGHAVKVTDINGTELTTRFPSDIPSASEGALPAFNHMEYSLSGGNTMSISLEDGREALVDDLRQWYDASFLTHVAPQNPLGCVYEPGHNEHQRATVKITHTRGTGTTSSSIQSTIRREGKRQKRSATHASDDTTDEITIRVIKPEMRRCIPPIAIALPKVDGLGQSNSKPSTTKATTTAKGKTKKKNFGAVGAVTPSATTSKKRGFGNESPLERSLWEPLREIGCKYLFVRFSIGDGNDLPELEAFKKIADRSDTRVVLELILDSTPTGTTIDQLADDGGYDSRLSNEIDCALELMDTASIWGRVQAIVPLVRAQLEQTHPASTFDSEPISHPPELSVVFQKVKLALERRGKKDKVHLIAGTPFDYKELSYVNPDTSEFVDGLTYTIHAPLMDTSDVNTVKALETIGDTLTVAKRRFLSHNDRLRQNGKMWIGPSGIGPRNEKKKLRLSKTVSSLPGDRKPLNCEDSRQHGCFGAMWGLTFISKMLQREDEVACIGLGDIVGPRGLTRTESAAVDRNPLWTQATYVGDRAGRTRAGRTRYFPLYHVVRGLARAQGHLLWETECEHADKIEVIAFEVPVGAVGGGGGGTSITTGPGSGSGHKHGSRKFGRRSKNNPTTATSTVKTSSSKKGFQGELWVSNKSDQVQTISVLLGYKASFAISLLDHTLGTSHADYDGKFLDQTLSSVILSPSPDPSKLSLELEPYAVARIIVSPYTPLEF